MYQTTQPITVSLNCPFHQVVLVPHNGYLRCTECAFHVFRSQAAAKNQFTLAELRVGYGEARRQLNVQRGKHRRRELAPTEDSARIRHSLTMWQLALAQMNQVLAQQNSLQPSRSVMSSVCYFFDWGKS